MHPGVANRAHRNYPPIPTSRMASTGGTYKEAGQVSASAQVYGIAVARAVFNGDGSRWGELSFKQMLPVNEETVLETVLGPGEAIFFVKVSFQ